ncbi:MAG TPA: long-chain fatty acid--CoA ligase [Thermoleophilaceae bacterium]|nr:long-chain fatty acid--CoA ligase [Thermoleophilaceae bacterium]
MLEGLMQNDYPLTVAHVLDRVRRFGTDSEVVTLKGEGDIRRAPYPEVAARADRLASALSKLDIGDGDRVGTFMWNNQEHFEAYLAVPSMGAVLNTVNIRLFPDQVTYIVNHAQDKVLFVDDSVVEVLEKIAPEFESVEHFVVVGDGDSGSLKNVIRYEELLADGDESFDYPELDERQAAALCYTSGTTGNPKGVMYSHRSTILHAMAQSGANAIGLCFTDRVLPIVPMFHVNAWGIPHAAGLTGASLVMPDRFLQGEPLARLIEAEKVTCSAGVPTVWAGVLQYLDDNEVDTSSMRIVVCGGAAVPQNLMQGLEERHGIHMVQGWGMTETSPVCAVAHPPKGVEGDDQWRYRTAAGRILPFVEARLIDGDGNEVEWDGKTTGELEVRGPWIARDYYEDPSSPEKFHDGWLRTGDICSIDERGYVRISDRSKDVIKSGGEWISSVELEQALIEHDAVLEAAVIARPDDKWSERPLACVVVGEGKDISPQDLREFLSEKVAKWWIPETFAFIDEVPKTSVGKFDKKVLRQRLQDGELKQVGVDQEPAKA